MTERVWLYTDEHVPTAVVRGLRQRGVDVLAVKEAGRLGASDREHLTFALEESRVIFTQDGDFLRLHAEGRKHAGIVYARQQDRVGDVIHGLILIHEVLAPEEMKGHVEYL